MSLHRLIEKHFYVKFGDPSCIVFRYRAEKQTNAGENPILATPVGVGNNKN